MRKSPELVQAERKWIGKRIRYYLMDVMDRASGGRKLDGPYTGVVRGVGNNEAAIEDRLEGLDRRSSIQFTGELFVQPDDKTTDDFPYDAHSEIIG